MKMEKIESGAIKYLCFKQLSTKDTYAVLVETLGDFASLYSTVARWAKEFKLGRTTTEDEHREGRPTTSLTEENVKKVEEVVPAPAPAQFARSACDFYLFPRLKKHFREKKFEDDGEVMAAIEGVLEGQDKDFYSKGIVSLEKDGLNWLVRRL